MKLSFKIGIIIFSLFFLIITSEFLIQRLIVFPAFLELEKKEASEDMDRIKEALTNEITHMDNLCNDWATWDDTYNFARNGSNDYIETNLPDWIFHETGLNLIYVIDNEGRIIWGKSYDTYNQKEIYFDEIPLKSLPETHPLINLDLNDTGLSEKRITGIFDTNLGPLLIATEIILTSRADGSPHGYMLMGILLGDDIVTKLKEQTGVNFNFIDLYNNRNFLTDKLEERLKENSLYIEKQDNKDFYSLYSYYNNISGDPSLLIISEFPRIISHQGLRIITVATISLVLSGVIIIVLLLSIINAFIINPIYKLDRHMISIIETEDFSLRVKTKRKDEIGDLTEKFNFLISKVQTQTEKLIDSYNNISIISSIGYKITSAIKLEEVLDAIYTGINSIIPADVFGIALVDKSAGEIDYKFFIEDSQRVFPPRISINSKDSMAAKCIKENKEIQIDDITHQLNDSTVTHKTDNPLVTQSLLYIPLTVEKEIIGILTVQSFKKRQYTDYHLKLLKALGIYIAGALHNSIIHEQLGQLNTLLALEKSELAMAKKETEISNRKQSKYLTEILDSIRYAERIQRSMLPSSEAMKSMLPNSFCLWIPKDIVGGDAYYLEPVNNGFYIALLDCTGHGVPGAMMTMVATIFLRRIITDYKSSGPTIIMKQLNSIVKNFLKQDSEDTLSDDGMDAAICFVDRDKKKLVYAGAKLSLYYSNDDKIIQIKGDRQSLGYKKSDVDFQFTEHEISIDGQTTFYLTTDGYIDQIGGGKTLPYGWKRFIKLLGDNQGESLENQFTILDSSLKEYMGEENPQVDDITVIGFKI